MSTSKAAKAAKEQAAKDALKAQIRFIAIGASMGYIYEEEEAGLDYASICFHAGAEHLEQFVVALKRAYEGQIESEWTWNVFHISKFDTINSATDHLFERGFRAVAS